MKSHCHLDTCACKEVASAFITVEVVAAAVTDIKKQVHTREDITPGRTCESYVEIVDGRELGVVCPGVIPPYLAVCSPCLSGLC